MRRIRPWMWIVVAGIAIVILYVIGRAARPPDLITPLWDSLNVLRAGAEDCRTDLDQGTARLHSYDEQLDTMRAHVRALEAIDPRGIPADSYEVYLHAFEQYNDSAAGWGARADTLRARLERCRDLTRTHNMIADSLRRLLVQRQR